MPRPTSIGIIGRGWVGSSVAISALHAGVANELLLHDAREGLAEGEALDLAQGSSFYPAAEVRSGTLEEMYDTDAVVIAAGKGGTPGQTRLDLLRDNAGILRELAQRLRGYKGLVVIVTNRWMCSHTSSRKHRGLPQSESSARGPCWTRPGCARCWGMN